MFNIIDIIALTPNGVLGVQSCGNSFSDHWAKLTIKESEQTRAWLKTPGTSLEIWAWRKLKHKLKSGKYSKVKRWQVRVQAVTLADLESK